MLTQGEANALIEMTKRFVGSVNVVLTPGMDATYDLTSDDERERFLLDVWRATIRLSKVRFQTRGRKVIVLVRLDVDAAPHTNPDGTKVSGTHIHLYREGYEDRWAYPVNPTEFCHIPDIARTLADFCHYCRIEVPSAIQGVLI